MDVPLLRTMTMKSTLKFGKHADFTVGQLIALGRWGYLRWAYYNCSMINFTKEVLLEIGVYEDDEISKPGKDPEKWELVEERKHHKMGVEKIVASRIMRKRRIAKMMCRSAIESRYFSKGSMQARNQGR